MLSRTFSLVAIVLALGAAAWPDEALAQSATTPGKPGNGQPASPPLDEAKPGIPPHGQGTDGIIVVPPLDGGDEESEDADANSSSPPRGCPYAPRRLELII